MDSTTAPTRPVLDPELQRLIPPLHEAELERLEANLLADGCRDPLVVWRGTLLDGHNRLRICERHGIPYATVDVDLPDKAAAMDWMLRNQLGRRNLTREQFTVLLGRRYNLQKQSHGGDRKSSGHFDHLIDKTADTIAAEHGVSEATVRRAAKTVEALPEVSPAEQAELLRAAREVKKQRRREREKERIEQRAAILQDDHPLDGERYRVFMYDVRDLHGDGDPLGIDPQAIITDPPYPEEFLPLYRALAQLGAAILPDGGSLLAMCGQANLDEVFHQIHAYRTIEEVGEGMSEFDQWDDPYRWAADLTYQWTLNYYTPGQSTQVFGRRVKSNWKPVLWYVNGTYTGEHVDDTIRSGENDKRFHEWGQSVSGMAALIERFTVPGDLVYDPFCGGGTTGVAALLTGRLFVGSDIDESCVKQTAARLAEVVA